ncbi:hypothetical protein [Ekhidna sp.]|uniref:hypothetical protein n=1 Tax=Ekhidna sp. TaxID=2608089 RepID=UPI0035123365
MRQIKENISVLPLLSLALVISILAFLYKGISYLLIGSSIPFLIGLIMLALIVYGYNHRNRRSRRIFRFWGWMLVFWGTVRLLMELMFILTSITEEHIQNQFTIGQKLLSISFILIGIFIIRKAQFYREVSV